MLKKTPIIALVFCLSLVLLCGCGGTMEPISSTSDDGNMTITVSGSQEAVAEPWMLTIVGERGDQTTSNLGVMWGEPTTENVLFEWRDNYFCNVKLVSRDGDTQQIAVYLPEN